MEDKTEKASGSMQLICPTCGARYQLPKYVEGQRYGCKRCSASLLFGKFALLQELGRGGFGVVYKAFQADLERIVALKFLHTDSPESTERFMREARIAANLSHPNITAIYEVGQHEGKPYITMQFVDGLTTNRASFSIREAVFVMRDAAIAVDYAHARDIIHRDIKPHNIMVSNEQSGTSIQGTARRTFVMDFGLARSANKGGTLTTEGQVMGTPAFMSPEQAEGKSCDLRSDVYSLGATLFSLVTKRPPFEAPTPLQILMAVTQEDPPLPSSINPEVDKGLEAIIMKAMAKDPAHRYPTAARFAQDLTSWLAGGVTDAGPTVHLSMTPGALKAASAKRKKSGAMVGVGLALILAGAGGLAWKILSKPDPAPSMAGKKDPVPGPRIDPPVPIPAGAVVLFEAETDPSEAIVRIDGRDWKSPVSLTDAKINPGAYDVVISKPGYETVNERVTITAGAASVKLARKLKPEARKVAFVVESTPPGAKILLNGTDTGATTPHTVYMNEVPSGVSQVELELEGFVPATRPFEANGEKKRIPLTAKTGTFVLTGAVPGATVHLFALPASIKNAAAVAGLWSENPDALVQAVNALDEADVPHVVERLKTLKAKPDPRTRERVATLAARPESPTPVKPEKSAVADSQGSARLENAWVLNRYRIFATSAQTRDYLSPDLMPRLRGEDTVTADMMRLSSVGAKGVRPQVGKFRVMQSDQTEAGMLSPGGAPVRVIAGPVQLQFVPPANDPVLREFLVRLIVKEPYELAGNLYLYSAEAYRKENDVPMAMRAYTKVLEEKVSPVSEQEERAKLPELIRGLYRGWVDEGAKQGKVLGGDLAARLDDARKKPPADAIPVLMELYAAKDGSPALRGGAAAALATFFSKQGQPYEAMEWADRFAAEKFDPGHEIAAGLAPLHSVPGLGDRWDAVVLAIENARKAALAKIDPATPPAPAAGAKVGVLQVTKFGIFIRFDPGIQVAKDDTLEVFRDGNSVGEVLVTSVRGPDGTYPHGYAECKKAIGTIQKGDEVRRKK